VSRTSGYPTSAGVAGALFEVFLEGHVPEAGALATGADVDGESVDPAAGDDSLF
jgi:hypothetical protein